MNHFSELVFSAPMHVLRKKTNNQKTISIRCFAFTLQSELLK